MWKKNFMPNKVGVRDSKSHIDKERNLSRHFATMHTDAQKNETLCAIWYHLHNLKSMKNILGRVLILVCRLKPVTLLKVTLPHGCFSRFLKFTNGTKSRKVSHMSH